MAVTQRDRAAYSAAYQARMQAYSMQSVTACERAKANEPWTPDEIEILLDPDMTRREKIDALNGRTTQWSRRQCATASLRM